MVNAYASQSKLTFSSFPLYSRGVDRYRFEYGVFLLNKNIEQVGEMSLRFSNM